MRLVHDDDRLVLVQHRQVERNVGFAEHPTVMEQPHTGTVVRLAAPRPFPLERRSHIVKTRGVLCAQEIPGVVNAVTSIERAELDRTRARRRSAGRGGAPARCAGRCSVRAAASARSGGTTCRAAWLHLQTGKTHQLRVHMNALGLPILGDDFYPRIEQRAYDHGPHAPRRPCPARPPCTRTQQAPLCTVQ